ncbi:solute carrier family 2, facilitated glucose transporter member 7 [Scaptodrosophila lebanonensis]|uniref:Solute carrier family 2, facilitated glucose transporter member 7 n=1 Tax=Drosophila lebanonensis TaxID=7225 RepID=A0A6J2UGT7_DROLE|nr:solute carrier family 2, facilitated glucose transporter member 7 [Scaptodrosophila lebanonensis]
MAEEKQGWTPLLFLICVTITIGTVIPIGYCFGVVNAPSAFIRQWASESVSKRYSKDLTSSQLTLLMAFVVSMFQVGGIVGSFVASMFNNKLGRKGSLLVSGILFLISSLCQWICRPLNLVELLLLGRLVAGFASGLVYSTQPMYLVELAPAELSGSVGVFTCIGITGGIVLGQIFSFDFTLGTDGLWHFALAAFGLFVLIGMVPACFFPESPRYLFSKGNVDRTKASLMRLRSTSERAERELAEMEATPNVERVSMCAVIKNGKLTMPLILVCGFHSVQQFSGISVIWYYSVGIFTDAGFSLTVALWLNFGEGMLNLCVALLGPLLMGRFNRRTLMMTSCFFSGVFLALLSIGLKFVSQVVAMLCIGFLSMYIISFNFGLASIPYFIGSELFEVPPRAAAMALGSLFNWLTNFIGSMAFPVAQASVGSFAFMPCAIVCILGFLLTFIYLPETRNREPKDVAPLLEHGFKSKIKEKK